MASAMMIAVATAAVKSASRMPQRNAAANNAKTKYRKNGLFGPSVNRLMTAGQSTSVACTPQENRGETSVQNRSNTKSATEWPKYSRSKAYARLAYRESSVGSK